MADIKVDPETELSKQVIFDMIYQKQTVSRSGGGTQRKKWAVSRSHLRILMLCNTLLNKILNIRNYSRTTSILKIGRQVLPLLLDRTIRRIIFFSYYCPIRDQAQLSCIHSFSKT